MSERGEYVYGTDGHEEHWLTGERIVRCRDCKHYTDDEMEYYRYCGFWCEQVAPDGFCSWGKRKVDE